LIVSACSRVEFVVRSDRVIVSCETTNETGLAGWMSARAKTCGSLLSEARAMIRTTMKILKGRRQYAS